MIAVEADWPDCATINDYIHGINIRDPLSNFTRFPIWMWKNEVMSSFTEWMKHWNSSHTGDQVTFYGLDVYSLQKYAQYFEPIDLLKRWSNISNQSIHPQHQRPKACIVVLKDFMMIP